MSAEVEAEEDAGRRWCGRDGRWRWLRLRPAAINFPLRSAELAGADFFDTWTRAGAGAGAGAFGVGGGGGFDLAGSGSGFGMGFRFLDADAGGLAEVLGAAFGA